MAHQTQCERIDVTPDFRKDLFQTMLRIREFEDRVGECFVRGLTSGSMIHLSIGEEATATGIVKAMGPKDYFTTHHRGHGVFIARGADLGRMMAEIFGKVDGYCKGKGGSMHIADIRLGHMGANAIVGGNIAISVGGGLALKQSGTPGVSVAFFGDGALQQGILYESMNLAALWELPVVFAVINNQYGMGTRIDHAAAKLDFVRRAETFGLRAVAVDGMDVEAVFSKAQALLQNAREKNQAGFIIADTYRYYGHGRKDPSPYRDSREEEAWKAKDPIETYRRRLVLDGVITDSQFEKMVEMVRQEVDAAQVFAEDSSVSTREELYRDVYGERYEADQEWLS